MFGEINSCAQSLQKTQLISIESFTDQFLMSLCSERYSLDKKLSYYYSG